MSSPAPRRRRRPLSLRGILLILALGAVALAWQRHHIRFHLPLIVEERSAASAEGMALLEAIGVPPGATPYSEGAKVSRQENPRGMWRGTECRVAWHRAWQAPGDPESVEAWYLERLAGDGWRPFQRGVPSSLQRQYYRGKWLLTLQRLADFSAGSQPESRFGLVLEWDYWHRLGDGAE